MGGHKNPVINSAKRHRKKTPIGSSYAGNIKIFLQGGIIEREKILEGGPEGLILDEVQRQ